MPFDWEPCSDGTYRTKEEGSDISVPRFDSVGIYFPLSCSSLGMGDFNAWAGRVEAALDATLSYGVEKALAQGVIGSTNPAFSDTNLVELAAGASPPRSGLRYLDDAIADLTGRDGMIHAGPAIIDAWGEGNGLRDNDHLATPAGTRVVSGAGYTTSTPPRRRRPPGRSTGRSQPAPSRSGSRTGSTSPRTSPSTAPTTPSSTGPRSSSWRRGTPRSRSASGSTGPSREIRALAQVPAP